MQNYNEFVLPTVAPLSESNVLSSHNWPEMEQVFSAEHEDIISMLGNEPDDMDYYMRHYAG